jgi:hypothetical protein
VTEFKPCALPIKKKKKTTKPTKQKKRQNKNQYEEAMQQSMLSTLFLFFSEFQYTSSLHIFLSLTKPNSQHVKFDFDFNQ